MAAAVSTYCPGRPLQLTWKNVTKPWGTPRSVQGSIKLVAILRQTDLPLFYTYFIKQQKGPSQNAIMTTWPPFPTHPPDPDGRRDRETERRFLYCSSSFCFSDVFGCEIEPPLCFALFFALCTLCYDMGTLACIIVTNRALGFAHFRQLIFSAPNVLLI